MPEILFEASAAGAARSLPEAERVLIEGIAANRRGDFADARASFTRLTELVPGDWRGHYALGQRLLSDQKYADAVQALKKATELNALALAFQPRPPFPEEVINSVNPKIAGTFLVSGNPAGGARSWTRPGT